jgi:hypothetical protein
MAVNTLTISIKITAALKLTANINLNKPTLLSETMLLFIVKPPGQKDALQEYRFRRAHRGGNSG